MSQNDPSPRRPLGKGQAKNEDGFNGSCTECSEYFLPLLGPVSNGKYHTGAMERRRLQKAKNQEKSQEKFRNRKLTREWI